MWQSDMDINSIQGQGAFTTIIPSTAAYGIFLDAYPWIDDTPGIIKDGFASHPSCLKVLRGLESMSELINTPPDWRFYRRWRSSEKAKMWDERYPPVTDETGGDSSDLVPVLESGSFAAVMPASIPKRPAVIVPTNAKYNKTEKLLR